MIGGECLVTIPVQSEIHVAQTLIVDRSNLLWALADRHQIHAAKIPHVNRKHPQTQRRKQD